MNVVFFNLNKVQRHDIETFYHSCRVANICSLIGRRIGFTVKELQDLKSAAYLHDLGKIRVSKEVLNKKDILLPNEWEQIINHPIIGSKILKRTKKSSSSICDTILFHHEYFNGSGYPRGLSGEDIPFMARIITVADGLDAMVTNRPYKIPITINDACYEIDRCSDYQFDPYIVNILLGINTNDLAFGVYGPQKLARAK